MKKKILLTIAFCSTVCSGMLLAQNWIVGGNNLAGPGKLGTTTNKNVQFITANAIRGVLTKDGLWGFGTTDPNTRVHINSDAGENPFRVQVNGLSKLYVDNGGGVSVGSSATPPANGLFVSGNAGIGTTSPDTKLQVVGGTDASLGGGGFIVSGLSSVTNIVIDDNEIIARNNGAASSLFLNNAGGNVIINGANAAGNVGIGISTPTSKLHVAGNIFATGNLDVSGTVGFGSVETFSDGGANTIESNSDIVPNSDGSRNLGTVARTWSSVHALTYLTTFSSKAIATAENLKAGIPEIMKLRPISFADGDTKKFGLVTKEVQLILPEATNSSELVSDEATKQTTKKATDISLEYNALIPVLIKGMQQQQEMITSLQQRIDQLETTLNNAGSGNMKSANQMATANLEQNQPNPFNQSTVIRYHLSQGTYGQINIYNNKGTLMKSFKTNDSGQTTINARDLKPGTYTYTLSLNGKLASTKKMVIIN